MDLGTTLRSAREQRGLTVESLAHTTKIKASLLRALEAGEFEHVPAGIFRRGFLRTYAREVGLDADAVVRQYAQEFEPETHAEATPGGTAHPAVTRVTAPMPQGRAVGWRVDMQWVAIGLVVAGFLGYLFLLPRFSPRGAPTGRPAAAPSPAVSTPRPSTASTTAPKPVATSGTALQIELTATGPCWVSATSGGQRLVYALLQPGDRRVIAIHDDVELRVGDPGALTYSINGAAGRVLGPPAQPVTVTIGPANVREFLAPSSHPGA